MLPPAMHLEIFVHFVRRSLGENLICTIQRESSFTDRAHPCNWPFRLVVENCSCKDWHGGSFPQDRYLRQPCGFHTAPLPKMCCSSALQASSQSSPRNRLVLDPRNLARFPGHVA